MHLMRFVKRKIMLLYVVAFHSKINQFSGIEFVGTDAMNISRIKVADYVTFLLIIIQHLQIAIIFTAIHLSH